MSVLIQRQVGIGEFRARVGNGERGMGNGGLGIDVAPLEDLFSLTVSINADTFLALNILLGHLEYPEPKLV